MTYVELHCHSAYSFLDGASQPEELVIRAAELGYEALALTDHDGVYGSLEFAHAAKAFGVRPITGAEVTLEGGSHVTLLVETPRGYANLCRLLTLAHAKDRLEPAAQPPVRDSGPGEGVRGNREVPPGRKNRLPTRTRPKCSPGSPTHGASRSSAAESSSRL
ncbi:MAG: PHP domain-containing protein [Gaiellales bacterium]